MMTEEEILNLQDEPKPEVPEITCEGGLQLRPMTGSAT